MAKKNNKSKNKGKTPVPYDQLSPEEQAKANDKALSSFYGKAGTNAGNALINKFLAPGTEGQVSTNLAGSQQDLQRYQQLQNQYSTRDPMQTDVLNRMQAGLGGYTSPEYQAQREQMQRGLNSGLQTSMSQLAKAQARGKVYGAAAGAQQQNLIKGNQDTKANLEQDLYVKNIDEMQKRLGEYGQYGRGLTSEEHARQLANTQAYGDEESRLRQEELDRQKINIGETDAYRSAQIGAFLGAGGTALEQKNLTAAQRMQQQGINAITGQGNNSKRKRKGQQTTTQTQQPAEQVASSPVENQNPYAIRNYALEG